MKHNRGFAKKIWAKNRAYSINLLSYSEDSWEVGAGRSFEDLKSTEVASSCILEASVNASAPGLPDPIMENMIMRESRSSGSQSRPFLDRLNFIDNDPEDRAFLQPSFSEDEMVAALRNMVGDKGPSPHAFNTSFFQHCSRVVKENIVYTSVCLADVPSEPSDFFPLFVNYQERFSAAGRTSGGFFKREGRAKDHEVLICRLIDRPLRPTMPKGFYHETQILSWVLSYDGLHSPDSLAVTAAGIAVALSELPNSKAIAGVRVGLVGDKFIVNPTTKEMEESKLDMLLAGTDSAVLMIEGYCDFLPEEKLLQAVEVGQDAVRTICNELETLVKKCGKPKMDDAIRLSPPALYKHVEEIAGADLVKVLQIKNKIPRKKALSSLEEKVITILSEDGYVCKNEGFVTAETVPDLFEDEDEDEEVVVDGEIDEGDVHIKPVSRKSIPLGSYECCAAVFKGADPEERDGPNGKFLDPKGLWRFDIAETFSRCFLVMRLLFSEVDVKLVFKDVTSKYLRKRIVEGGKRSDGRTSNEIRLINSQCGLLPRAHGSALFTRGETQSLAVVTLGDKQMAQRIDNLVDVEELKRFYLQ
ncbi:hypothetical protein RJ639_007260, partial [Escallonia herrerae]